ncbi:MAG: phenylalanine--tRNA ligase subunit alpha [Candidatus Paracaedibacteraceae bacterium]|nr:phenylalanine--tRNA ligase subunit alpha [Candidatus Paracaedibacteraceae bacterium]
MQSQLPTWLNQIKTTTDLPQLEALKAALLGKSGAVTQALKGLAQLPSIEEKKAKGAEINVIRDALIENFQSQTQILEAHAIKQKLNAEALDITLPFSSFTQNSSIGRIHPLTSLKEEIADFFQKRGFTFAEGPEVEDEWHNFDALNIPSHHPARQNHDTFFIQNHPTHLLRTHTSTVQIRSLATQKPPLRLISVGRVYRSDDLDATHTPMFHQIEGLVLDKNIHMGHLKGLIREFCSTLFGVADVPVRFRPSFFPFTEPSAEVDIACTRKDGKLVIGKGGDWLELLGCGMVHPNVLTNCDVDPLEYQGFAFGMGLERLCMIKNGIADIRQLYDGDETWLKHFGSFSF